MRHKFITSQESRILNNLFLHYLAFKQNFEDTNGFTSSGLHNQFNSINHKITVEYMAKADELFEQYDQLPKYLNTSDESIAKNFISKIEGDFNEKNVIDLMRSYAEYSLSSQEGDFKTLRDKIAELGNTIDQKNDEKHALIEENKQLNTRIENLEAGLTGEVVDKLRKENEQLSRELWELKEGFNFFDQP